jgi:hypothetical protein
LFFFFPSPSSSIFLLFHHFIAPIAITYCIITSLWTSHQVCLCPFPCLFKFWFVKQKQKKKQKTRKNIEKIAKKDKEMEFFKKKMKRKKN